MLTFFILSTNAHSLVHFHRNSTQPPVPYYFVNNTALVQNFDGSFTLGSASGPVILETPGFPICQINEPVNWEFKFQSVSRSILFDNEKNVLFLLSILILVLLLWSHHNDSD